MSNRSLIFVFVFLQVLFCIACQESEDQQKAVVATTQNPDTVTGNPYQLSAVDLSDDSIFNDGSRPVSWENAGVKDPLAMKTFIRKLQVWVRDNYVDSISSYLVYPMRNPGITDKKDFKLNYSTYFSDGVKAALAEQRLNQ